MSDQSRRTFLFASSGAAAGSLLIPGLVDASQSHQEDDLFAGSGLITGEPKRLKHDSIPGFLSAKQIAPHHTAHNGGALKGYVPLMGKSKKPPNPVRRLSTPPSEP